jgi:16S rRNA (cytosine967-C5)-methyltransferase
MMTVELNVKQERQSKGATNGGVKRSARAQAVVVLEAVLGRGRSLATVLPLQLERLEVATEGGLMQELCYGTLRWLPRLEALAAMLLTKPLRSRDRDIYYLILLGLYQLVYMRIPAHAAVDETVVVARGLGKDWARAVVNGVLRNFQRQRDELEKRLGSDAVAFHAHPRWLLDIMQAAWPEDWPALAEANQQRPPMTLRVNRCRQSRQEYQQFCQDAGLMTTLHPWAEDALVLNQAVDVLRLPGFEQGWVSVQDAAAQLAPGLLDLQTNQRLLDACAAPGGKTAHLLEVQRDLSLVAVDIDEGRLQRVADNLQRLDISAELICGDAAAPEAWWDGELFDRLLIDAPCSATGVIRRHPDIKYLRQADDIAALAVMQRAILAALWPLLKPGGRMLYVTCSILPQENHEQMRCFLDEHDDAMEIPIKADWGRVMPVGRQVLSGSESMDGFYYACIAKHLPGS